MAHLRRQIGKYRVIDKITESNYAQIYTVVDDQGNNFILKLAKTDDATVNEMISREYNILSQIKHPNIVRVYDYDKQGNRAYFTLEFIPGQPITQYFTGFSEDFVIIILQIISALGKFHSKGFVHCDLKPENILFDPSERHVKLIDFGFAGVAERDIASAGTIGYIAPEVIKGIAIHQCSDLYSLGIIMYEILSRKKYKQAFTPIEGIPEEINKVLSRLVSEETALRPTIPELHTVLSKYVPSEKVEIPTYQVRLPGTGYVENTGLLEKLSGSIGVAIVVTGETGLGKTRLLQELKFHYLKRGYDCLLYTSPSPRDRQKSRMPSSA
jgi:serine/threonine protein kinase